MDVERATRCTDGPLQPSISKTNGFMKEHWCFKVNKEAVDASYCGARYSCSPRPLPSDLDLLTQRVNGSNNPKEFLSGCFQDTMTAKVGRMDR